MEKLHRSHITVGIDGSRTAITAARWAAAEAHQHNVPLRLVHAYVVPTTGYPNLFATFQELKEGFRAQGRQWLDDAADVVVTDIPAIRIEIKLVEKTPAVALLEESIKSGLVVLGSRGLGGFTSLLVGSTAIAVAAHAHCPVAVVRGSEPGEKFNSDGPVLLGADGSSESDAATAYAFEEASFRNVPLIAMHTWNDVTIDATARIYPLTVDPDDIENEERLLLAEQLAGWQEKYPDVTVERLVLRGRPLPLLLDYAKRAQLVVVGSRGRGSFRGMLLGSVSRGLLLHSPCPVFIARSTNKTPDHHAEGKRHASS